LKSKGLDFMSRLSVLLISFFTSITVGPILPSVAAEAKYNFTEDWVTPHANLWREQLKHLKGKPNIHALEIGSFEGRSALWFLENILTDATSTITCVDLFIGKTYEAQFDHNIRVSTLGKKVGKIKGSSQTILRQLKLNRYDFIYIDGSHLAVNVLMDAVLSWDLLKVGGIIIFDDYLMDANSIPQLRMAEQETPWVLPRIAIDAFLQVFRPYLELRYKGYQVIVRKNKNRPL